MRQLGELYELLGFAPPRDVGGVSTLPVRLGVGQPRTPAIELRTRSLWDLFTIAAASVDVPMEHIETGIAPALTVPVSR